MEYLGDRYSFGRPLSSYQALKHRVADDKMLARGLPGHGHRGRTGRRHRRTRCRGGSSAWPRRGSVRTSPKLLQDCVQLHGGIGVTYEHDLHLYLRRATVDPGHLRHARSGTPIGWPRSPLGEAS